MSKKRMSVVSAVILVMVLAVSSMAYAEPGEVSSIYMETLQSTFEGIKEPIEEFAEDEIEDVLRANGIAMRSLAVASNFRELKNALSNPGVDVVMLLGNIQMEEPLEILPDRLTLLASTGVTVYSAPSSEHFYGSGDLYITFFNVTLDGNGTGGGLDFTGGGELLIEGAFVKNCGTDVAVYAEAVQNVTLQDGIIRDNAGTGISTGGNLTINNSVLAENGNSAVRVVSAGANVEINGSILYGNSAAGQGGGIYAELGSGQLTLDGCAIASNETVSGEGGGVYVRAKDVSLIDTVIEYNKGTEGGGIFAAVADGLESSAVTISGGRLEGNTASEVSGGGLCLDYGPLILEDTEIKNNDAYLEGGGVRIQEGSIIMNNTSITDNKCNGVGGGLYIEEGDFIFSNGSTITGNKASLGGGISWGTAMANLTDTEISGNEAQIGGGVFVNMHSGVMYELTMNDSSIEDNVANMNGGGLSLGITDAPLGFRASGGNISNNTARSSGGGIHVTTNFPRPITLADMTIEGNYAGSGGALYVKDLEEVTIESGVVFANNKADKGYIITDPADIAIHDANVHTKSFSAPFTEYAYNNYDIAYTKGTEAKAVQVNFYLRASDSEPYYTTAALASQTLAGRFPEEPTYEGLVFAGWIDENNKIYNADTEIIGDVNLYALWHLQ